MPLFTAGTLLAVPAHFADAADLPPALVAAMRPLLIADEIDPRPLAQWDDDYAARLDVSPDGIADWNLDFNALGYPGWCGTGGCRHQLWVSDGKGYVLALDEYVVEIAPRDGAAHTLDVELHGGFCNEPGNAPCSRSFTWNAGRHALDEMPNASGLTLLTGPLFQPVATDEADWPEPVRRIRDATVDRCVEAGGNQLEWGWPASSIPDIDGDGARDWVIDESWLYCGKHAENDDDAILIPARVHLFVSNRGRWTEKLDVPDADWAVDISSKPASLIITPDRW